MRTAEKVYTILTGATLWARWIHLQQFAGQGSSPTATQLANNAQTEWRTWRDANPQYDQAARSMVAITREFAYD